ncbi:hypothetical protein EDB86DRAFT_3080125 [Lactarius hatsudake]|nr:hypothetical protein EDB86DRAFT_3080125 [Lactarius hatsudake]
MEYDAWGQPLEGTGYDWYRTPLIWDDDGDCWALDPEYMPSQESPNTPTDPWWDWQSEAWPHDNARVEEATNRLQEYEAQQHAIYGKNWRDVPQPEPREEYEPYVEDWYLNLVAEYEAGEEDDEDVPEEAIEYPDDLSTPGEAVEEYAEDHDYDYDAEWNRTYQEVYEFLDEMGKPAEYPLPRIEEVPDEAEEYVDPWGLVDDYDAPDQAFTT